MLPLCFKKEKASAWQNLRVLCLPWLLPNAEREDDSSQEAVTVNVIDNPFPVQAALNGDQRIPLHVCEVHGHQWGRVVDLKRREICWGSRKAGNALSWSVNIMGNWLHDPAQPPPVGPETHWCLPALHQAAQFAVVLSCLLIGASF